MSAFALTLYFFLFGIGIVTIGLSHLQYRKYHQRFYLFFIFYLIASFIFGFINYFGRFAVKRHCAALLLDRALFLHSLCQGNAEAEKICFAQEFAYLAGYSDDSASDCRLYRIYPFIRRTHIRFYPGQPCRCKYYFCPGQLFRCFSDILLPERNYKQRPKKSLILFRRSRDYPGLSLFPVLV